MPDSVNPSVPTFESTSGSPPTQDVKKAISNWNDKIVYILSAVAFAGLAGTGIGLLATATFHVAVGISLLAVGAFGEGAIIAKWQSRIVNVQDPTEGTLRNVHNVATSTLNQTAQTTKEQNSEQENNDTIPVPAQATTQQPPTVVTATSSPPVTPQDQKSAINTQVTIQTQVTHPLAPSIPPSMSVASPKDNSSAKSSPSPQPTIESNQKKEQAAAVTAEQQPIQPAPTAAVASSKIEPPVITFNFIRKSWLLPQERFDQFLVIEERLKKTVNDLWNQLPEARKAHATIPINFLFFLEGSGRSQIDSIPYYITKQLESERLLSKQGLKVLVVLYPNRPQEGAHPDHHPNWFKFLNENPEFNRNFVRERNGIPFNINCDLSDFEEKLPHMCLIIAEKILESTTKLSSEPTAKKVSAAPPPEVFVQQYGVTRPSLKEKVKLLQARINTIINERWNKTYSDEAKKRWVEHNKERNLQIHFVNHLHTGTRFDHDSLAVDIVTLLNSDNLTDENGKSRKFDDLLERTVKNVKGLIALLVQNDGEGIGEMGESHHAMLKLQEKSDKGLINLLPTVVINPGEENEKIAVSNLCYDIADKILPAGDLRVYRESDMFNAEEVERLKKAILGNGLKATKEVPAIIVRSGNMLLPTDESSRKAVFNERIISWLKKEKGNVAILLFNHVYQYKYAGVSSATDAQNKYFVGCCNYLTSRGVPGQNLTIVFLNGRTPEASMDTVLNDAINKQRFEQIHNFCQRQ